MMMMNMNIALNVNRCRPLHSSKIPRIPRTLPLFPSPANLKLVGRGGGILTRCRAAEQLLHDLPFSLAIGASLFNTLLFSPSFPAAAADSDDDDGPVSSTDARFAVMTLISFIPFFNWLSWVFALMDTGHRRYAVYALVYLAPYIRTDLSLSPDESWLPIVSIVLCIVHIQLEASIRSGDLESFNLFSEIGKRLGFIDLQKDRPRTSETKNHDEERRQDNMNLPLGQHHLRDEIRKWKVPRTPSEDVEHADEDGNLDDRETH